jgi:hypothetical protein
MKVILRSSLRFYLNANSKDCDARPHDSSAIPRFIRLSWMSRGRPCVRLQELQPCRMVAHQDAWSSPGSSANESRSKSHANVRGSRPSL